MVMVTSECVGCYQCQDTCPVDALTMGPLWMEVNDEVCVGCGVCVDACPVEAIKKEEE